MSYTLDVGCGSGQNQQFERIKHRGTVNADILRPIKPIPNFVLCDVQHLPFKDKGFNKSLFIDVIEHVDNPPQALKELKRVTTNNIIVGTPNALYFKKVLRSFVKGDYEPYCEHITVWGFPELTNLCRHVGLTVEVMRGSEYRKKENFVYKLLRHLFPDKMRMRQIIANLKV